MEQKTYGYARVSTREQNEARQLLALEQYKIPSENIFIDRQSGQDFNRPQYKKLMRRMHKGDLLIVQSIDRLGRNYDEILEQWRFITKEKQADILIIDMPLLDTRKKEQDLTSSFIADLALQKLAYVAQAERENIKSRQAQGIAAAKSQGVHMGRHPKPVPDNFEKECIAWMNKKKTIRQAAAACGMPPTTFFKKASQFVPNNPAALPTEGF